MVNTMSRGRNVMEMGQGILTRPVAREGCTRREERDLRRDPTESNISCQPAHSLLHREPERQARVHNQHACLDGIDHVEHGLLRQDDDLRPIDAFCDLF